MTMPAYIPKSGAFCIKGRHLNYHDDCDCPGTPFDHSRPHDMPDILQNVQALRGFVTGSAPDLSADELNQVLKILVSRLAFWVPSTDVYDHTVKRLIQICLKSYTENFFNLHLPWGSWTAQDLNTGAQDHQFHTCRSETCNICLGGLQSCDICHQAEGTLAPSCPGPPRKDKQGETP